MCKAVGNIPRRQPGELLAQTCWGLRFIGWDEKQIKYGSSLNLLGIKNNAQARQAGFGPKEFGDIDGTNSDLPLPQSCQRFVKSLVHADRPIYQQNVRC